MISSYVINGLKSAEGYADHYYFDMAKSSENSYYIYSSNDSPYPCICIWKTIGVIAVL